MSFWKLFRKWIRGGCVWYTAISILFLCLGLLSGVGKFTPGAAAFLWMLPWGLSMSAAGMLYRLENVSGAWRKLLHYGITVISFLLFVLLPNNNGTMRGSTVLILLVLLSALYWLLFLLVHIFRHRIQRLMEED